MKVRTLAVLIGGAVLLVGAITVNRTTDDPSGVEARLRSCVAAPVTEIPSSYPERFGPVTGTGITVTGSVVSEGGCDPVTNVEVQVWAAGSGGDYAAPDATAVELAGDDGTFVFTMSKVGGYGEMYPHVHGVFRAPGHCPTVATLEFDQASPGGDVVGVTQTTWQVVMRADRGDCEPLTVSTPVPAAPVPAQDTGGRL